ncbi:FtsK/SpoIIIE domain-containing protein [Arthrobacter agilis]|uniref:FtsK/SpoIIIE domain-containing protein n=1 Tax=Arthrobacter agilis TaxID=37921 RepID=UPI0027874221|nr:FtsK/SpoIIIE domain-containing protein [Arthrobacter agilis]MDQ0734119.1 S-DNA-T family DNA segregation ATPase FtsK/SpoIIIE [Arthrobacter agilis]
MKLRLTLRREPEPAKDLAVTVDGLATVSDVARELYASDPGRAGAALPPGLSLTVDESYVAGGMRGRTLDPDRSLFESGLRPGSTVTLTQVSDQFDVPGQDRGPSVATLRVLAGPDAGKEFSLPVGASYLGRDRNADIRFSDPMMSKRHARINIADTIEIIDTNSANGLLMGGTRVNRATLTSADEVALGDTTISVVSLGRAGAGESTNPLVEFNRSPRVVPSFEVAPKTPPAGPKRPQPQRFPYIMMAAPLLMGMVMFAVTRSPFSALFALMMPLILVANYFDQRGTARRSFREAVEQYTQAMAFFRKDMDRLQRVERAVRHAEAPSVADTVDSIYKLGPLLWTHRPEHASFLTLRFGTGTAPSRVEIREGSSNDTLAEYAEEIARVVEQYATIDDVPIVANFRLSGALGLAGPRGTVDDVARGLVTQAIGLHSPAELVLTSLTSVGSKARWGWLQWLPHAGSVHSPLAGDHLAAGPAAGAALLSQLEDLIAARSGRRSGAALRGRLELKDVELPAPLVPSVLVVVEDDAPVDRARLTRVAELGADVGVHLLWIATSVPALPAACRDFLAVDGDAANVSGQVRLGRLSTPVSCESVDEALAGQLARMLTPVIDVGTPVDDDSDLPRAVSYVTLAGHDLMEATAAVADRWTENNSVAASAVPNRKHQGSLRALVGSKGVEPMYLDLKTEGPHALVGGTTGAGKSEFLQSWVLGMAAAYSPDRLTFLFVDYKGGAAFAECVQLPHTVGLVTDLSPHLVRRALTSLRAELHYREHLFNRKKAKDLLAMEREADPETPPSLIIVVDEFAALAREVPEFVDGVVDVAARGRSLGLHLILATQRPAGVIKDNLRANTNMRIALRMADTDDSEDILGDPMAAYFSPTIPGRGAAKTGPGRIQGFQTGYAGGWTTRAPARPRIDIVEMDFGSGPAWEREGVEEVEEVGGPNDISRIVANVSQAAIELGIKPPRKPWLAELAAAYDFSKLPNPRTDERMLLGVADDPAHQAQPTVFYAPDTDGNMAFLGAGGSGKSAALRTLAIGAAVTVRGGPMQVYGIDCASNGLQMLDQLPHVGAILDGEDSERIGRLLRYLRGIIDERADRFAEVRAGTITEYRKLAGKPDEPRILLLVDGLSTFRENYEFKGSARHFELFQQIATDGRPMGVHVVVTGERTNALPPSLAASIQRRIVLRLAGKDDYAMLGVPKDVLSATSPPGRGLSDGQEIQLAIFGGNANLALQAREVEKLRDAMLRQGVPQAPGVLSLPETMDLDVLPMGAPGSPVIGVDDFNLEPAAIAARGGFMVSGPPGAGRTVALVTLAAALQRSSPQTRRIYFGSRKSSIASLPVWDEAYATPAAVQPELARLMALTTESDDAVAFFIEGVTEFTDSPAEMELSTLVKAAIKANQWVVGEAETSTWSSAWNLAGPFKSGRRGLLLNPGEIDGDTLLSTSVGRTAGNRFIPGRGYLIGRGKAYKVQVATTMGGAS